MKRVRSTKASRFGQWAGRQWRRYVRRESEAILWLKSKGLLDCLANVLAWSVRISILLLTVPLVVLVTAIIAIVYVPSKCLGNSIGEPKRWTVGDQDDHKKSVFYDPINYNDPDDPRFDD
ncbi:DUF3742 family protein [Pseudomonas sp. PGPR40]|uniref:DUF3742 family protein n=1 Tax=Pseudomonas sp. PGPR40 TaxID=2913476 RepID=UPI003FA72EF6